MRKTIKIIFANLLLIVATGSLMVQPVIAQGDVVTDSLTMTQGYANDVYYSFATGEVLSTGRNDWEIGFYTTAFSVGIITNGGVGIKLYAYPNGDTSDWANIDTTGFYSWEALYNSPTSWEEGAFNHHALGHPDYGWGVYNSVTHHIVGDSLFIIDLPDSGLKKLWIIEKDPINNVYKFRFAKLDGTEEHEVEYDIAPYTDKRFAYYSLTDNLSVDREPVSDRWDILFTKYVDWVPDLDGNLSPYIVTGVLNNVDIATNQFYPVGPDFMDWQSEPMDSVINHIGYNWKVLAPDFTYEIQDSNYYFVRNYDGDVYKLWFLYWAGSSTGNFALNKQFITTVSVDETKDLSGELKLYPNPTSGQFNISLPGGLKGEASILIYDQAGRLITEKKIKNLSSGSNLSMNDLQLSGGIYFISVRSKNFNDTQKLIVR